MAKKEKYYKRPDGLFEAIRTVNGKRKAFRGRTCREVDRKILEYRDEAEKGWTFTKAADNWYREIETEVAHATYRNYGNTMRRLVARFGPERIAEITPEEIVAYIRQFEKKDYSRDTVQLEISVLKLIFRSAINRRTESGLAINPAAEVRKSKGLKHRVRTALTEEQEAKVEATAREKRGEWWLLGYFLMYTGLRRGEALALTWRDIDRKAGVIHVCKKLNYDNANVPLLEDHMKSENGRRDVPIFDELARMLPRNQIGYVFPSPGTGKYLTAYELAKYWKQYCRDAGLMDTITADNGKQKEKTQVSPHCFRHTFATICYEAGVDARTAAEWLGDSVAVMEKVYINLRKNHRSDSVRQVNEHLSRAKAAGERS